MSDQICTVAVVRTKRERAK